MNAIAWGRLFRLSLAPSAAADIAAGLVVAHAGAQHSRALWWLVPSSLAIYHGSMALNDWSDREADAKLRRDRPIPSGAVSADQALSAATMLLALGVALAWLAAPSAAWWMAGVALCATLYNLFGRGAWLGPILLGLCRAANFGAPAFCAWFARLDAPDGGFGIAGDAHFGDAATVAFGIALLYGAYVFFVSRLGRLEDVEDERAIGSAPRASLLAIAAALAALPFFPVGDSLLWRIPSFALAWSGSFGLVRYALSTHEWNRGAVLKGMGLSLRRLLVFSSSAAALALPSPRAAIVSLAILAGYPIAFALRRVFPPS